MTDTSRLFSALIILESQHPDEPDVVQIYEQRIVIFRARDEDDVRLIATSKYAKSHELRYFNADDKLVIDHLVEVLDVYEISPNEITDQTEVYSQFLSRDELEELRRMVATPFQ